MQPLLRSEASSRLYQDFASDNRATTLKRLARPTLSKDNPFGSSLKFLATKFAPRKISCGSPPEIRDNHVLSLAAIVKRQLARQVIFCANVIQTRCGLEPKVKVRLCGCCSILSLGTKLGQYYNCTSKNSLNFRSHPATDRHGSILSVRRAGGPLSPNRGIREHFHENAANHGPRLKTGLRSVDGPIPIAQRDARRSLLREVVYT